MKIVWMSFFLFLFLVPYARGDPLENRELIHQIKLQNELMGDLLQLYQAGYNPTKTDMAALLDHKKIEKYLVESSITSKNTGIMLSKMDALKEGLDDINSKMEGVEIRLVKQETKSGRHEVMIDRNTIDISRIFYVIAVVSGFLAAAAWAGHSWAHRNDDSGG